jgi:predicted DCC family thiol-disulfide oxidoreductase YuxK
MQISNGWTYRQYLGFRFALGAYTAIHFASLLPWGAELFSGVGVLPASASPLISLFPNLLALNDGPLMTGALLALGCASGIALAFGVHDRGAALAAWYVWACLFGRNPLISNPSLPYVGWLLLAHAVIAPKGLEGIESRRAWRIPEPVYKAGWVVLAVGYSYSGLCKLTSPSWLDGSALSAVLQNPLARDGAPALILALMPAWALKTATWGALALEIGFAPLACVRRWRPFVWAAMLAMHLGLLATLDFADLTWGMILVHAFVFDPSWIRGDGEGREVVFYDGHCGLCQSWIQLLLEEDRREGAFVFAPLGGKTFHELLSPEVRSGLPDSIVVLSSDGRVLVKSVAILRLAERMGGGWRILALLGNLIPRAIADAAYDGVARVRRVLPLGIPVCRRVPGQFRARLLG